MSVVRYASLIASTVLHGTLALAFVDFQRESASFEAGTGSDQLRIEQGIAIEGLSRLGEAPETIQARDAETVQASQAVAAIEEVKAVEKPPEEEPPPPEVPVTEQPPELKDVITSPLGPTQDIVTAMHPPPELPTPQPEQKPSEYQPEQVCYTSCSMQSFPARLHVLLAREAPVGLVIRRGPSRQVCTLLWDRRTDSFTLGQWFKGRI